MSPSTKKSLSWFTARIGGQVYEHQNGACTKYTIQNFEHAEQLNMAQEETGATYTDTVKPDIAYVNKDNKKIEFSSSAHVITFFPQQKTAEQLITEATQSLIKNSEIVGIIVEATQNFPYFKVRYQQPDWFFNCVFNVDCFCIKPLVSLNPADFIQQNKAVTLLQHLKIHELLVEQLNCLLDIKTGKRKLV